MPDPVDVATRITLRIVFILFLLWLVLTLRFYLVWAFGALMIVAALDPLVTRLERLKIPRSLSSVVVLLGLLSISVWLVSLVIPPLVSQIQALIQNLPEFLEGAVETLTFWGQKNIDPRLQRVLEQFAGNLSQRLLSGTGDVIRFGQSLIGGIFMLGTFVVLTLYLLIEYPRVVKSFISLLPKEQQGLAEQKITVINLRLGGWLRGQILLVLIIGGASWVGLSLLQIPYALPLSLVAGVLEIVPTLGPLLASIPAIVLGLAISPWKALSVALLYFFIQQVENTVVVPKVMQHSVGLDPVLVLIVLTLGGKFLGLAGLLVSIPATLVLWVLWGRGLKK
ncbi:hypothetical protein B5M47_01680 [candidate division CPR3 bacterium 4484_211]|uniref:AI-2E family transporter n=1 Tax=candidate division CPR3 bacterium 4484_211 TaxID=1968527 RepID=A0A1W9NYM5_UNCC3|nr:MAG: hypothetical protein B5M47_01680 [candidate division CPR3 bacterium 4484_211]